MAAPSLQQRYAQKSICFGCGPSNDKGLRIGSFEDGQGGLICVWQPEPHHQAFPGMLNGGIIGALLDCHCNWTAAWALMKAQGLEAPPCTVTAEYGIKLLRPTPTDQKLTIKAKPVQEPGRSSVKVRGELYAGEDLCATCEGVFVAVKPGHPAYHRW